VCVWWRPGQAGAGRLMSEGRGARVLVRHTRSWAECNTPHTTTRQPRTPRTPSLSPSPESPSAPEVSGSEAATSAESSYPASSGATRGCMAGFREVHSSSVSCCTLHGHRGAHQQGHRLLLVANMHRRATTLGSGCAASHCQPAAAPPLT
jgi:hypothetical protein